MRSCFKLSICAGGHKHEFHQDRVSSSAETDGNERRVLSDKIRWSFRRKSASQRVIVHNMATNADVVDLVSTYLHDNQPEPPEKSSPTHLNNEEIDLLKNSYEVDVLNNGASVEESAATLIQTVVRKFLVRRELAKYKMTVKLQAAVRGHLVRRNAVESLHCLRAILKIQALVHARYGKSSGKPVTEEKAQDDKYDIVRKAKDDADSKFKIGTSGRYIAIDKLQSSCFVRQLMKSTPNPKRLSIYYITTSHSPAWSWMERWMSFVSRVVNEPVLKIHQDHKTNDMRKPYHEVDIKVLKSSSSKVSGGSESGTEISISSDLDSPDGSHIQLPSPRTVADKMPDEGTYKMIKDGDIGSNDTNAFCLNQEIHESGFKKSGDAKTVQEKSKGTKSDARREWKIQKNIYLHSLSTKDSPRNFGVSPGSLQTPSSQLVSRSGKTKNSAIHRRKDSWSSVKKPSLSSPRDLCASDSEQLQQKVDRRRSSLSSDTFDLFKEQTTYNSGSVSLPSYMKATVSAKARLLANTSPKLSPDVLSKDTNLLKRQSLPLANVKQISPKLRQPSKGNVNHSSLERKLQK